jgi:uncharacterized protein (TIGR02145 family)
MRLPRRLDLTRLALMVGFTSLCLLIGFLVVPFSPPANVAADSVPATTPLKSPAGPVLTLAASGLTSDDPILLDLGNAMPGDPTSIKTITLTTTTDNSTGYLTTINTKDANTCLRPASADPLTTCDLINSTNKISPVAGTLTADPADLSLLQPNQWGIAKSATFTHPDAGNDPVWFQVPAAPLTIDSDSDPSGTNNDGATGNAQPLTFGAKLDYTLPIATYQTNIVFTASTNPLPPATITSLSTTNAGNNLGTHADNPATAGTNGGDTLTITGTNLAGAFEVTLGTYTYSIAAGNADHCDIINPTEIQCTLPSLPAGDYALALKTWGSPSGVTADQSVTYAASPVPTITDPTDNQLLAATTSVTLTATTPIYATCYYGTAPNPTAAMTTTNALSHSQTLTVAPGASYTYYVRCQYPNSPVSADVTRAFAVKSATPATPTVTPSNGNIAAVGTASTPISAVSATTGSTCVITVNSGTGTISGSDLIGRTNGSTTVLKYTCTVGSGATISDAVTGTWTIYVKNATPAAPTVTPGNGNIAASGTTSTPVSAVSATTGSTCVITVNSGTGSISGSDLINRTNGSTTVLKYSCTVGSGSTISDAVTGTWTIYVKNAKPTGSPTLTPGAGNIAAAGNTEVSVSAALSGATCTVTKSSGTGTVSGGKLTGRTNGSTTVLQYSCVVGTGSVQSDALTGTWTIYVRNAAPTVTVSPASGRTLNFGTTTDTVTITPNPSTATCTITKSGTGNFTYTQPTASLSGLSSNAGLTLNYSCVTGTGSVASTATTGSWTVSVNATPSGQAMTTLTKANCTAMTTFTGSNTAAVAGMWDNSDGTTKYYAIAKLADGRCWMISNYARAVGTQVTAVSSSNWTTTTGLTTNYYANPASVTPLEGTRACTGNGYATTAADAVTYLADSGKTSSVRNCGYLYNWRGATAGTGTSSTPTSTIVSGSICPTGWHLPSYGSVGTVPSSAWASTNEYGNMYTAIGGTPAKAIGASSIFRVSASGYLLPSGSSNPGVYFTNSEGTMWASTSHNGNASYAYAFSANSSSAGSVGGPQRYRGGAVRCVLNN